MYGCFVDIRQQDGKKVRMHYGERHHLVTRWIGINEKMADKFFPEIVKEIV